MGHGVKGKFSLVLTGLMILTVLGTTSVSEAAGQIYVNDGNNVLSGDVSSAYVVGGMGNVSVAGGTYVITGDGIKQLGQSAVTPPVTIPDGSDDGTTVAVKTTVARIGLYYFYNNSRNTSLSFANLENKVGSGYQFGYYDSSRVFHQLGNTTATKLTMMPDLNTAVPAGTVGAFHIKLPNTYPDFTSTQTAASKYSGGFPAYINGLYYVLVGNYQSADDASAGMTTLGLNGTIYTGSSSSVTVTKTDTLKSIFELDCGTTNLAVHPVSTTKAVTWFKSLSYYGDFEYFRYLSDKLTVINVVNIEDYIKGVVAVEMSSSWPIEALKAQALCARSYYATNIGSYSSYGFDVTADTYSQAYKGTSYSSANSDAAVDATAGEYVTYGGSICSTFFFASDGGSTENSENIFVTALPYCRGVFDPFEDAVPATLNSYKSWHYEFTGAQIAAKLASFGYIGTDVTSVTPTYSDTNNVIRLLFEDNKGNSIIISKSFCYSALGLPSVHYTITAPTNASGNFVIDGGGWGHNVGMSQWGAYSMAKNSNLNYRQIIRFYYTGVNISKSVMA